MLLWLETPVTEQILGIAQRRQIGLGRRREDISNILRNNLRPPTRIDKRPLFVDIGRQRTRSRLVGTDYEYKDFHI